ncbi:STE3-domain-containing protein [Cylindrobasidium torrendii FP15055 ss-10]|uniref:STE3-domain-containing protein n=1 Tax=Cylindrobasidium torrendii FP15055 ss-10 TaxID=1314674 RepID=A0A0D7B354_9AGAR|nr:STE3-domain-containing protein [Cylindrobasidium torrendii FP15055 ss-10]
MADAYYPLFQIFAVLAIVCILVPLPWHLQAWNTGTCMFMIWVALAILNFLVNTLVWKNNVADMAPIWCDISTRITLASSVGISAASLCINRRLYKIAAIQSVSSSREDRRRDIIVDLVIGVGIPLLQLPAHFVVNGHRYDIVEDVGCMVATFNTPPAYPLTFLWPNVLCLVSVMYSILTIRAFLQRRAQFNQFLSSTSGINRNRYFRLLALASVELLVNIPVSSFGLYLNTTRGSIHPWVSWEDTHYDWFAVRQVPSFVWRADSSMVTVVELQRWAPVFISFVFFGFFGFADEARKSYKAALTRVGILSKQSNKKNLQLPFHNSKFIRTVGGKPSFRKPVRTDSLASSTVVSSPTSKISPSEIDASFGAHKRSGSVDSIAWAESTYAPPATWPTCPAPRPTSVSSVSACVSSPSVDNIPLSPIEHSIHTIPSLSAFPEPPTISDAPGRPESQRRIQDLVQVTRIPESSEHVLHLVEPERARSPVARPFSTLY